MSNFTYQQIVDFLRESTGDNNWYLNNKIGQPIAHRYFQPLAVQRHVTEAVKKMRKMKDEEHAGDFAHKARQSAAAGKTTFTIGGTTYPVKANPNVKENAEQVDEGSPEFNARALRYAKANAAEKDREGRYSKKYPGGKEQHAKDTAAFMKRFPAPKNEEADILEGAIDRISQIQVHPYESGFAVTLHSNNGPFSMETHPPKAAAVKSAHEWHRATGKEAKLHLPEEVGQVDELTGIKTDMGKATKFYRGITNRIKKKAKAGLDTTSNERSQQNASHAIANMYKEEINKEEKMAEASHINGRVEDPMSLRPKQTSLSHVDAVKKYGKNNVKLNGKNRLGKDIVMVSVPLGEQETTEGYHDGWNTPNSDRLNKSWKSRERNYGVEPEPRQHPAHHDNSPHDVHVDGKKWKTFGSAAHAHNVANKLSISGKKASVHKTPDISEKAWSHGHGKMSPHYWDRIKHLEPKNEEVEQVYEVLNPSMGADKYIHDFVHSDNPKFDGKSKKERIRMALGAYYHAKKNIQEYTEHTHAVHFENGEGEWEGMAFIHAKDDEDAKEQAHHMANSLKWAHLNMSHLEKHTPIVEEGVVSNEDELINILAETFGLDEATKEQKLAARAARNARMAGSFAATRSKMSVKLQRRVGIAPEKSVASTKVTHQSKSVATAKSASHPENHDDSPVAKMRKINQARQDAYYAKGGREGFGSGGGSKNSSPLEKAMLAVKEKPVKGAGASPAELDAELKAKKKPVAEAYLSEKKMKKEELNTDMLDGHENDKSSKKKAKIVKKTSKLKRKYMGKNKGRTATGERAHVIETEVTLHDAKT